MKAKVLKKGNSKKLAKNMKTSKKVSKPSKELENVEELMQGSDSEEEEEIGLENASKMEQSEYLSKLKQSDPEFYAAMMEAEDLDLPSGSDDDDDGNGQVFVPPKKLDLQQDSDEEAEYEEDQESAVNAITPAIIKRLQGELQGSGVVNAFREMEQALLAAIESLGDEDDKQSSSQVKVEGPQMFNAVVKLCLQNGASALQKMLNLKNPSDDPSKSKKWGKMKTLIKPYLKHMVKLTEAIAEPDACLVLLKKGVLPILGYYIAQPMVGRGLVNRLITLWATSHQKVRVLAFIAIFRITRGLKTEILDAVLKKMYLKYVQNSRFTTPSSWSMIDFMRVSLNELYSLDTGVAYRHAFIYIRQMAFHLRNAILVKKKEKVQLVYNWQYIHCLHLWSALLSRTHPDPILQPLIYPLTQIAVGTMKLQPSAKFYPLVFHICGILIDLSQHTSTFIPILPFLLEALNVTSLNKKHKKISIKPFPWICMLKLSKSQMLESAFKDGVVDQFYDKTLKYLNVEAASIGFPELVVPAIYQLKIFLKKTRNPNYSKKIKQLIEKINENTKYITQKRKDVSFTIDNNKAIKDWEIEVRQSGTPIQSYYESWSKAYKNTIRQTSNKDEVDNYGLPVVRKRNLENKKAGKTGFDDAFGSSDEDADDESEEEENGFLTKSKSSKKRKELSNGDDDNSNTDTDEPVEKKNKSVPVEDEESESEEDQTVSDDVVKEMKFSDLEDDDDSEEVDEFDDNSEDDSEDESE